MVNFEVLLWTLHGAQTLKLWGVNVCITYRLMITSSFMGEPSGFLRNSGIFLSVSELLILLRGFVAFFFVTFFVAQVSNLLGYIIKTLSVLLLSKLYIRYNNYRMVHILQKIFYFITYPPSHDPIMALMEFWNWTQVPIWTNRII